MKLFIKFISVIYLAFMVSCNTGQKDAHTHTPEDGNSHTHEAEAQQHTHEAEAQQHTHEAEAQQHTHEAEAQQHTHEAEAQQHTHETEAQQHTHEAETQQQTHEAEAQVHSHTHESHTIARVQKSDFSMVYKASGLISTDNRGISNIVARTAGIVRFEKLNMYPGSAIKKGELMFRIGGESLIDNNSEAEYKKVKTVYESAKKNFERASRLIEQQLITEEHFLRSKSTYESALADFDKYNTGTVKLNSAPSTISGYINEVKVSEGQMVKAGDILASVINTDRLILRADIPISDMEIINNISTANFRFDKGKQIYRLEDLDGRFISGGLSLENTGSYIPVYFSFSNSEKLIPGTFTDIWLKGKTLNNVICIPNTSIMEEYGRYYVFVEKQDHEFEKRFIERGNTDGISTMVLGGLHEGETIVTTGTYQVKLALLEGTVPDIHAGHSH